MSILQKKKVIGEFVFRFEKDKIMFEGRATSYDYNLTEQQIESRVSSK
jgi:hypothetical protein